MFRTKSIDFKKINLIVNYFFSKSKVLNVDLIDSGLINETYIIEHLNNGKKSKFILQRLSDIFESHDVVITNHKLITDHIEKRIRKNNLYFDNLRWEFPSLISYSSNNIYSLPFDSGFWRAMLYIDNTLSFDTLEDNLMAFQAGIGLAKFHLSCSDFDFTKLQNSIKYFHDTKHYIDQFYINLKNYDFIKLEDHVNIRVQKLIHSLSNNIDFINNLIQNRQRCIRIYCNTNLA